MAASAAVKRLEEADVDGYYWTKQDCPICEIAPSKFVGRRGGSAHRDGSGVDVEIWKCARCGLVFPNPMPYPKGGLGQHYDVGADDYFGAHDKDEKLDCAGALLEQGESILGRKGRLLDVGVGRGEILMAAKERGWEIEGVEPSATFADYAEKRSSAKIWRQEIENSSIPANSYDVIILAAVLEHLYCPDQVIGKISEALVTDGLLFVDVPNESGLYFMAGNAYQKLRRRDWCVNLAPTFPPFHVFGFSPKSLRMLLTKHRLKPRDFYVYGGKSLVPKREGFMGFAETLGSKVVTALSNIGEMGTYIATWAVKQ